MVLDYDKEYFGATEDNRMIETFFRSNPTDEFYVVVKYRVNTYASGWRYANVECECVDLVRSVGGPLVVNGKCINDLLNIPSCISTYGGEEVHSSISDKGLRAAWVRLPNVHVVRADTYAIWLKLTA